MSKAVSRPANDSDTINVALSGVTTIPFGNAIVVGHLTHVAIRRDERDDSLALGASPPRKSKPMLLT